MNRLSIYLLIVSLSSVILAQQRTVEESFVIQKERSLTVPNAERSFNFNRSVQQNDLINSIRLTFDSLSFQDNYPVNIPGPAPVTFKVNINDNPIYSHLIKAGLGNRFNTLLAYQYLSSAEQKRNIKINAFHESIARGPIADQQSSENNQQINWRVLQPIGNNSIQWKTDLDRYQFNYFGLADSLYENQAVTDLIVNDARIQTNNHLKYNWTSDKQFSGFIGLSHQYTNYQTSSIQEHIIQARGVGNYQVSEKLSLRNELAINQLNAQTSISNNRFLLINSTNANYHLTDWYFKIGLKVAKIDSLSAKANDWLLFPDMRITRQINKKSSISIGLMGDLKHQSLYETSNEVIYLSDDLNLLTQVIHSNWYLQYQQGIGDNQFFNLLLDYRQTSNQGFFQNSTVDNSRFELIYEDNTIGIFEIAMNFNGEIHEKVDYEIGLIARDFYLNQLSAAFHIPAYEGRFGLSLEPTERLSFQTQVNFQGKIPFSSINFTDAIRYGNVLEWQLKADYRINRRISTFLELNNILNKSNMRYYLYRTSPFLMKAGINLQF